MRGFRIGRAFGIELRADWSWVVIFVLLTWNLVAVFSQWHADWAPVGVFVVALCASLVFFGCILLHELAHSIVAKSYGVPVRSITLFLFGGVSNIEREPPSAKAELFTAIVGPLVSLALGLAFAGAVAVFTHIPPGGGDDGVDAFAQLGPIGTLFAWLAPVNIVIGLFNLIPGFPLDGGRVLRAILWHHGQDLRSATITAAGVGRAIGWLFIGLGILMTFGTQVPVFGTGVAGGIWLALIGWFLHGAAMQATARLALDDALAGMTVDQLMRHHGPIAAPDMTIAQLVYEHLVQGDDRALPVLWDDGTLAGLVSFSDVRRVSTEQWGTTTVRAIMRRSDQLALAEPYEPLAKAFERLALRDVNQLPVVVDRRLVGMLRRHDVARWIELAWRPRAFLGAGGEGHPPAAPTSVSPPAHPIGHQPAHHPT
jgi:Zn-dependent protease/CBS domain-containing protein